MKRVGCQRGAESAATLIELLIASSVALVILGVITYASMSISKTMAATERQVTGSVTENRLMDYVTEDLRRAVRVSILDGSTSTVIKDTGSTSYTITETTKLVITIPDYYASNTPNNSTGSAFKTTRYPRTTLNTASTYNGNSNSLLDGTVPWSEAQTTVGGKSVTRFAPSSVGSGEMEVRYYRGPRSSSDATVCFFRSEYPAGSSTASSTKEIAERVVDGVSSTTLAVSGKNGGQTFRLQSSFVPTYTRKNSSASTTLAFVEVSVRNPRRD